MKLTFSLYCYGEIKEQAAAFKGLCYYLKLLIIPYLYVDAWRGVCLHIAY